MMERTLVAPIGNPGSGKTLFTKHLADSHGFEVFDGGTLFKNWVTENYGSADRRPAAEIHSAFRKAMGPTAISDTVLQHPAERLVYDNPRNLKDFYKFRKCGGITVALWCPIEERSRRRSEDPSDPKYSPNLATFSAEEKHEYSNPEPSGCHVIDVMQQADHHLDAFCCKDEFRDRINELLAKIGIESPDPQLV